MKIQTEALPGHGASNLATTGESALDFSGLYEDNALDRNSPSRSALPSNWAEPLGQLENRPPQGSTTALSVYTSRFIAYDDAGLAMSGVT